MIDEILSDILSHGWVFDSKAASVLARKTYISVARHALGGETGRGRAAIRYGRLLQSNAHHHHDARATGHPTSTDPERSCATSSAAECSPRAAWARTLRFSKYASVRRAESNPAKKSPRFFGPLGARGDALGTRCWRDQPQNHEHVRYRLPSGRISGT